MFHSKLTLGAAAASLALATFATGQMSKGTEAPEFEFGQVFNDAPERFDGFQNRLVLVEFFATW